MFEKKMSSYFGLFTLIAGPVLLSACFSQPFDIKTEKVAAPPVSKSDASAKPGTETQTAITFKTLQPALAVRGASCLMCHAQVDSNVVTDFGYGDRYFLDKDAGGNQGLYSDFNGIGVWSWTSSVIHGSLIVPRVDLDHTFTMVNAVDRKNEKKTIPLADALLLPWRNSSDQIERPGTMSGISPPEGSPAVIDKKKIYIGAPSEAEILALGPNLSAPGFVAVHVNGIKPDPELPLSGLQLVSGSSGTYVTNSADQPFVCAGDVMIRGTVFLNSLNLKTNNGGCRLYVSGSVFIQGAIKYSGQNLSSANLQITSASLIAMGFGQGNFSNRILWGGDSGFKTRSPLTPNIRHQAMVAEAAAIPGLIDAGDKNATSALIPYNGLLLNAPEVHSRYVGNFTGAVIAEIAMFRLNNFKFTFDPIFKKVPIFPALKSDILSIED